MHYRKPGLLDVPVNKQTRDDLNRLLGVNHDAFAEDERQIGTIPLIKMSIDTGRHPPIAQRPYALALKHCDWVRDEMDKLLEAGVIRESNSSTNCCGTQRQWWQETVDGFQGPKLNN